MRRSKSLGFWTRASKRAPRAALVAVGFDGDEDLPDVRQAVPHGRFQCPRRLGGFDEGRLSRQPHHKPDLRLASEPSDSHIPKIRSSECFTNDSACRCSQFQILSVHEPSDDIARGFDSNADDEKADGEARNRVGSLEARGNADETQQGSPRAHRIKPGVTSINNEGSALDLLADLQFVSGDELIADNTYDGGEHAALNDGVW